MNLPPGGYYVLSSNTNGTSHTPHAHCTAMSGPFPSPNQALPYHAPNQMPPRSPGIFYYQTLYSPTPQSAATVGLTQPANAPHLMVVPPPQSNQQNQCGLTITATSSPTMPIFVPHVETSLPTTPPSQVTLSTGGSFQQPWSSSSSFNTVNSFTSAMSSCGSVGSTSSKRVLSGNDAQKRSKRLTVFKEDMSRIYHIPARRIESTKGGKRCIEYTQKPQWMRELDGDEVRRFFLCPYFANERGSGVSCPEGMNCNFIHVNLEDPEIRHNEVHLNRDDALLHYIKLKQYIQGHLTKSATEESPIEAPCRKCMTEESLNRLTLSAMHRNSNKSRTIHLEQILYTKGAEEWYLGRVPEKRLYICAHFTDAAMCTHGTRCGYLHILDD